MPGAHAPAVAFAFFPTIARLLAIKLENPDIVAPETLQRLLEAPGNRCQKRSSPSRSGTDSS